MGTHAAVARQPQTAHVFVNDIHSQLTPTHVARIVQPRNAEETAETLVAAGREGLPVSVCGARHAMGRQQFVTDGVLLDLSDLRGLEAIDVSAGSVEVGTGICWPELVRSLHHAQAGRSWRWTIRQKQTGADRLTLGGAVAANVHGRGLRMAPFVGDVEALTVVTPAGEVVRCARDEHGELFRLVCGGYGLFGVVTSVRLRLARRHKVQRAVELTNVEALGAQLEQRLEAGFEYGDFQFAIDPASPDFLRRGVFSCYRPVADDKPVRADQRRLSPEDWQALLHLAHVAKSEAFARYSAYYLQTDGQVYWSDLHQLSVYLDGYHADIDRRTGAHVPGSEVITELFVPRSALPEFMGRAREALRSRGADPIYGTVRWIERDEDTILRWAREPWACIVLNLHVDHEPRAKRRAAGTFRDLIDAAAELGGTFYLTYHAHATRRQLETCHPQLRAVLRRKRELDPHGLLQSDWYRGLTRVLGEEVAMKDVTPERAAWGPVT